MPMTLADVWYLTADALHGKDSASNRPESLSDQKGPRLCPGHNQRRAASLGDPLNRCVLTARFATHRPSPERRTPQAADVACCDDEGTGHGDEGSVPGSRSPAPRTRPAAWPLPSTPAPATAAPSADRTSATAAATAPGGATSTCGQPWLGQGRSGQDLMAEAESRAGASQVLVAQRVPPQARAAPPRPPGACLATRNRVAMRDRRAAPPTHS